MAKPSNLTSFGLFQLVSACLAHQGAVTSPSGVRPGPPGPLHLQVSHIRLALELILKAILA
jgi:hypothetical protein